MNLSRVAAKQLTSSDLSFFAQHLRRSKQKGINLNSDVFVDVFYPSLQNRFDEIHFPLTVIGPASRKAHALSRKAIRPPGGKNWRLNGEMIHDPPDEPGRYDSLQEGDIALMAFDGSSRPEAVALVLITQSDDAPLHGAVCGVANFQGRQSMVVVAQEALSELMEQTRTAYANGHPLETILTPDSLEEAVFGSAVVQQRVASGDGRGAAISQQALRRQLQGSEETGQLGEEAFERWLLSGGHQEDEFEWVSRTHARAAYDFLVHLPRWPGPSPGLFVDVKATKGAKATPIHMGMAELRWAAEHANYRIARVYELGAKGARLSVFSGVHEIARTVAQAIPTVLPPGVSVDGFELETDRFREEVTGSIDLGAD